jgi:hypothetical protein
MPTGKIPAAGKNYRANSRPKNDISSKKRNEI